MAPWFNDSPRVVWSLYPLTERYSEGDVSKLGALVGGDGRAWRAGHSCARARETGAVVTVEDHSICGEIPVPVCRIGLPDVFGLTAPLNLGLEHFGISSAGIVRAATSRQHPGGSALRTGRRTTLCSYRSGARRTTACTRTRDSILS